MRAAIFGLAAIAFAGSCRPGLGPARRGRIPRRTSRAAIEQARWSGARWCAGRAAGPWSSKRRGPMGRVVVVRKRRCF